MTLAWVAALGALIGVRVAVPLAALAAEGRALPGLPRYDYEPTPGDGSAYYAAAREFLASWERVGAGSLVGLALALLVSGAALGIAWRRRPGRRGWAIVIAALLVSLVLAAPISRMQPTGAGAAGWPLLWSLPMLPYRALGAPLDPDIAFGFGLTVSLLANAVTVTAIAYAGRAASRRAGVGLLAAGLFAFWPLLSGLLAGARGWENGTWQVDAGLHMYTEPVSTALVTCAMALVLSQELTPIRLALAGVAAGLAATVRPTNGIIVVVVLVLLAGLGTRRSMPFLGGALAVVPIVVAFWPRRYGYELTLSPEPGVGPSRPFSVEYIVPNWMESLLFSPRGLLVVVPLAVVGAFALRSRSTAALVCAWALSNPVFYSLFEPTHEHPRYLFASLPGVCILWAAGATALWLAVRKAWLSRTRTEKKATMMPS